MATTWTYPDALIDVNRVRAAQGACTTGSESPGGQGPASLKDGIDLKGLDSVTPHIGMVKASGTLTLNGVVAGDTVTINGRLFTAVNGAPAAQQFQVGGSNTATAANLAAAINADATTNASVTASAALAVVTVTAIIGGTAGNALTLAQAGGHVNLSGATLAGGSNIGAGASLQVELLNPVTGVWHRAPDLDMALTAGLGAQALPGFAIAGPASRLRALPNAVGAACTVYLNGHPRPAVFDR